MFPPKILVINHEYPPVGGGAATVARELLTRFQDHNYPIALLTGAFPSNTSAGKGPSSKYSVYRVPSGRKSVSHGSYFEFIKFFFKSLPMLRLIHKGFHPDITLAFFTIPGGLTALVQKWIYGIPYIVSVRGGDIPGFVYDRQLSFLHQLSKPVIKLVCKNAVAIHTNSERLKKLILQLYPKAEVKLIPNGTSMKIKNQPLKPVNGALKILFVGRLSGHKNLETFLKALAIFVRSVSDNVKFTIVGEGSEKSNLQSKTIKLGINNLVDFKGWLSREEVGEVFQHFDFSVIPSIDEGMPNTALESISAFCPVLGSTIGTIRWNDKSLREKWIVKNEMDVNSWVDKLNKIYIERESISDDARKMYRYVSATYNYNTLFPLYESLLRESAIKNNRR